MPRAPEARDKLIAAATELIRRNGYVATSVDDICGEAGVTKGAFFHHFESKDALAEECLAHWAQYFADVNAAAPYQQIEDAVQRVLAFVDYFATAFASPKMIKSCLAGTTVSDVSESNATLRKAANQCLVGGQHLFKGLLDQAAGQTGKRLDTASLAALWMATFQGSLVCYKASRDPAVIVNNFKHLRNYLEQLFS